MERSDTHREGVRRTADLLHRVNRAQWRLIERSFQSLGIHGGQHRLLMELERRGPAPKQTELARCMDITPASVANMLKRLENGGYIERSARSGDERCNEVQITPKGLSVVQVSKQTFMAVDACMLRGFSDEDITRLQRYFERIEENLRQAEEAGIEQCDLEGTETSIG